MANTRAPGDGPYRTAPLRLRFRRSWLPWILGGALAIAALLLAVFWPRSSSAPIGDLPLTGIAEVRAWPPPEPELGPATPLAPLLVADQPQALAVVAPGEGASRLRRGESLWVRFNRPMVRATEVGRPTERSPLVFDPPLEGVAQWTSRSSISFAPSPRMFDGVREVRLDFAPGLAALSGEALNDELERVVVLDGAPRVLSYQSQGRVLAGAPLPLVFDAPVSLGALRSELLAYEVGGGQRTLPVSLAPARAQPESGYRVDVRLARALEPGAQIAVAIAPRYQPWGGSSPAVMEYQLAPRPFIEGIACDEGAAHAGQCMYSEPPGSVIDIGPTLRVLASARVGEANASNVRVVPALREMSVRLAPHGPPQHRLIEIAGEWEPDQVYEVRVSSLRTEEGEPVRALAPLAVRSQGHPPEIAVETGLRTFERDAERTIRFSAIHPEPSDVLHRAIEPGEELRALISPHTFVRDEATASPLAPFVPGARANRWASGRFPVRDAMSVVAFRPNASSAPNEARAAFVQSTDLGVTVRANATGLLVWVTSLSSGEPVRGATISVADANAREIAEGTTDRHGVARIDLDGSPLVVTHAIRVVAGGDRAAILLDPRSAVIPAGMGLTPGAAVSDAPVATLFTDRGAYRPGESLHAKITLRRVESERASAVRDGRYSVRLFAPGSAAPIAEEEVRPSRFGTAAVDFDLPRAAALGEWRIDVARRGREESLGEASLTVAEFRQPTFRVDLTPIAAVESGGPIASEASATYLFGAPVTRGHLRWTLSREGQASYPERWSRYRFTPIGASVGYGTVAEGDAELGADGRVHIGDERAPITSVRTQLALEAEVTDGAGHTHAARRTVTVYPASVEVGLLGGDDWVPHGAALDIEAIAIDRAGGAVVDHPIEARIVREGWHSWWEWSERSHGGDEDGSYQLRRDQRREVVHTCRLTSAIVPVRCVHTPARPGTYVLEVEARDGEGRTSLASRRLYVAGPDEAPDRDPPGAPIQVTPVRARMTVGETAELAFESPFESAQALITVEREGVMRVERRRVGAGGQVIRVPITAEMVPNVFVGVTLVRARTGPPGERVDLSAPDLRFGIAELSVLPATSRLNVTLEVEASARPGTEVPVAVRVLDARGRPVRGEVALWAVDEGTLRLTGYQVPDPSGNLFRARPASFAWEDLRRTLVSRIEPPQLPQASGDGGEEGAARRTLDDRERFDPTPLWAPLLTTDARGRASATITLPERPTEYRVMAVAIDEGARSGGASAQLLAEQPLVVRPAFPRFLTGGDRFEAAVFVHNATEEELRARVWATIGGERRPGRTFVIPAGGEVRVAEPVTAPAEGPLALRFDARANGEQTGAREEIPIAPRGRFARSHVFGAARDRRTIAIGLPEGTPRAGAHVSVHLASHPFVGLEDAVLALDSGWAGTEALASSLLGLCAYAELEIADRRHGLSPDELAARGRSNASRLLDQRNYEGGFGRWSTIDGSLPSETALAYEALHCASQRGWIEASSFANVREYLIALANGSSFGDWYGEAGLDRNAYALRVLADAGAPQSARADALYEQRERLSPYGLADLAMALGEDDSRSETLLLDAIRIVLADRAGEANDPSIVRWNDHSARAYAPVLSVAVRFDAGRGRAGELASRLLAVRGHATAYPWGGGQDTARALRALAAYAELWRWQEDEPPALHLDGDAIAPAFVSRAGAYFSLPVSSLRGDHRLSIGGEHPVFFSIDGRWAVPIGEPDTIARGRRVAVHRVYETPDGRRIEDGSTVPLGALIRVRLFVHTEETSPEIVALHDPLPAGFEAVDAGMDTTPHTALMQLMGTSPDDEVVDGRAHHAMRSLSSIAHRSFAREAASFWFDRLPSGLAEYTYAIRATSVGEFTVPPAQIEAMHDAGFVARSTMSTLRVIEREE